MLTYLVKRQMKKKNKMDNKKIMAYTGLALTGAGAYMSYRVIKKRNSKCNMNEDTYLNNSSFGNNGANLDDDKKMDNSSGYKSDLVDKVNEFNSKRISHDNCEHVSNEEMQHYLNTAESDKDEITIENNYGDKYDEYEEYEEDLKK